MHIILRRYFLIVGLRIIPRWWIAHQPSIYAVLCKLERVETTSMENVSANTVYNKLFGSKLI